MWISLVVPGGLVFVCSYDALLAFSHMALSNIKESFRQPLACRDGTNSDFPLSIRGRDARR